MDQTPLFFELERLFQAGLFSNVCVLADLLVTIFENVPDAMKLELRVQTLNYLADSYYHLREFRRARNMYQKVDQQKFEDRTMKKFIIQVEDVCSPQSVRKFLKGGEGSLEKKPEEKFVICNTVISLSESKYRQHLCYMSERMFNEAFDILLSIPEVDRNAKIHMALAKLNHRRGHIATAAEHYKNVLKDYPLALEAADCLLTLGVDTAEVSALVYKLSFPGIGWVEDWIEAMGYARSFKYTDAIRTLCELLCPSSILRENPSVLLALGEIYYFYGDLIKAKQFIKKSLCRDPTRQDGYGILATICLSDKDMNELGRLVPPVWDNIERENAELLMTVCCYLYINGKTVSASNFAEKACSANPLFTDAFIIRGCILFDLRKVNDAISVFREAYRLAPTRYEPQKGLVDCYLYLDRIKDALTVSVNCCLVDAYSARSTTVYAFVLIKDGSNLAKAKQLLEAAVKDHDYLPAVYILADLYFDSKEHAAAIELLTKQVAEYPCSKLYQKLGEFYQRIGNAGSAIIQFETALRLDPANHKAKDALVSFEDTKKYGSKNVKFETIMNDLSIFRETDDESSGSMEE